MAHRKGTAIAALETFTSSTYPQLVHIVVETSDGVRGLGETYHRARPVATHVHDILAPLILGLDSLNAAAINQRTGSRFDGGNAWPGVATVDSSAASAIDIALWDLRGKLLNIPVVDLLGGRVHQSMRVYNTCVGYGFRTEPGTAVPSKTNRGFGLGGTTEGPFEDFMAMWDRPAELAKELLAEGYCAMKLFTFNPAARETAGAYITPEMMKHAVAPVAAIREAVGFEIDLMMDLNFMWTLAPCRRIIEALKPFKLLWIEDALRWGGRRHHPALQQMTDTPIAAFDYGAGYENYLRMIEDGGLDIIRLDVQWCGGITEAARIASLANTLALPVVFHDCAGPVQFVAATHLALNAPNTSLQESARAYWRTIYPAIVTQSPVFERGKGTPPPGPGLGTELSESHLGLADLRHIRTEMRGGEPLTRVIRAGSD